MDDTSREQPDESEVMEKVIFKDEKEPPHRWMFFSFTKTPM
jgi:hypothetical protein